MPASTPKSPTLSAQTLVGLLCRLMRMDKVTVARVAGVPRKNMQAWIAGKRQALRLSSIAAILHTVGIRIDALRTVLDAKRVHFWEVRVPALGRAQPALAPVTALSRLFKSGFITEVHPLRRRRLRDRFFRRYFLIAGNGPTDQPCKVVVTLHTYPWRNVRVTPEVVKGAVWRDDNDHHCMAVDVEAWQAITTQDMTVREFDLAFEDASKKFHWQDVILMAREFGVVAEEVAEHIMDSQKDKVDGPSGTGNTATGDEFAVRFLLGHAA